jgi:eukaryotic-like serine/threonine-protein kinase
MQCPRCHRGYPPAFRFCPHDGVETVERLAAESVRAAPTKIGGNVLGRRYRVRGFIGKGAMARVYLAEDETDGRAVAVKVLEEPYRSDSVIRERFQQEAHAASMIGHPSIVKVHDVGEREEDAAPYIVMEFLFGESLRDYVEREGTIGPELAVPAFAQAASALAAAHRVGVIHRDVKPDNLYLIGEPGDPYELKVLDFGLSKVQTHDLTSAGVVVGTPAYMAPEQILGEDIDARTDVYALGMVMYRTLTGHVAFDAEDEVEMIACHVWRMPPPPSRWLPELDQRLEALIMTALEKNPEDRYPSMDELERDLERLAAGKAHIVARELVDGRPYAPKTVVGRLVAENLARALPEEID